MEQPQEQHQSSYEQLMRADFIPRDIQEQWIKYEHHKRRYRDNMLNLEADEDLTPEAKQRKARALEQSDAPKIEKEARELRAALLKSAESAARSSLPIPLNESLNPEDPTKVLISQNEAARIHRRVERAQNSKGPFKPATEDILRQEYEKALELGGTRGAAIIRGCLMLAEELGMDTGWVPRQDRHREALDRARRREWATLSIPTRASVPATPRSLQPPRTLSKRPERNRATAAMNLVPRASQPVVTQQNQSGTLGERRAVQKDAAAKKKRPWK